MEVEKIVRVVVTRGDSKGHIVDASTFEVGKTSGGFIIFFVPISRHHFFLVSDTPQEGRCLCFWKSNA